MIELSEYVYADIVDWDEDRDGPLPDFYDTECPRCGRVFQEWHGTTYTTCACGCVFDPSRQEPA